MQIRQANNNNRNEKTKSKKQSNYQLAKITSCPFLLEQLNTDTKNI